MKTGGENFEQGDASGVADWSEVEALADQGPNAREVIEETKETEEPEENEDSGGGIRSESQEMEGWPEALVNMRENWGDLEHTQGVFGPNTEMVPYEYGVIGENMTFDEFAEFGDMAYKLGHSSEKAYNDLLFDKGCELQKKGLCLWTSFATAVRRYNTIKHLPELGESPKFYFSTNLDKATHALRSGRLEGWAANEDLPETFSDQALHMSCDLDGERAASSDMVTFELDDSVVQEDSFDLATRFPTVRDIKLEPEHQVVIAKSTRILDRLRNETRANEYFEGSNMPMVTRNEWLKAQGLAGVDTGEQEDRKEYGRRLIDEAVLKVNKREVKEFVDGFLDRVDPQELAELLKVSKADYRQGARETTDYFSEVLGLGHLDVLFEDKKSDTMGEHLGIGGAIRLNERHVKRHPKRMIEVVAHEVFHEYQQMLGRQYEKGQLEEDSKEARRAELYAFCKDHYDLTSSMDWTYRHQVLEREAFAFGDGVKKLLRQGIRKNRRVWYNGGK